MLPFPPVNTTGIHVSPKFISKVYSLFALEQAFLVKMLRPLPRNARFQYCYFWMSLFFVLPWGRVFYGFVLFICITFSYGDPGQVTHSGAKGKPVFRRKKNGVGNWVQTWCRRIRVL